jgi:hypothetical protein
MKAHINLRSTLSNTTTLQRGSAALAALALMALIGALLVYVSRPSAQSIPRPRASVPAQRVSPNPNVPISGTGSAYDGGAYGSLRQALRIPNSVAHAPAAAPVAAPALRNPNVPISGTGSAYDGGHYTGVLPAQGVSPNPNVPISGTGSAYDGGHYGSTIPSENTVVKP